MSKQNNFENEWTDVFEGAEITPPTSVWSNVRAEIAAGQARKQSGLVTYWRWMAAASVALLIGVGIGSYYYSQDVIQKFQVLSLREQNLLRDIAILEEEYCETEILSLLAEQNVAPIKENENREKGENHIANLITTTNEAQLEKPSQIKNEAIISSSILEEQEAVAQAIVVDEIAKPTKEVMTNSPQNLIKNLSKIVVSESLTTLENDDNTIMNHEMVNTSMTPHILEALKTDLLTEVKPDIQPRKVPNMMEIIKMQQGVKKDSRGMWAGLSIGGGSFDSNIGRDGSTSNSIALLDEFVQGLTEDGQPILLNARDVNQTTSETPAFSYAISADFGKQIGRKTFIQGGVEYSRYSSSATSNIMTNDINNESQAFLRYENTAALAKGSLTATDSYDLSNSFQYVAIPLKFGYQVLNKKIGISLSSGVSTNFFLKNTLKDKSGARNDVEVTNGESSPYKPLNFNGLLGAEISYQWSEHYQLAIVPEYRVSLDGVTKIDAFIQNRPTAFFLGFRFKYILK